MSYAIIDAQGNGGDFATSQGILDLEKIARSGLARFLDEGEADAALAEKIIEEVQNDDRTAYIADLFRGEAPFVLSNGIEQDGVEYQGMELARMPTELEKTIDLKAIQDAFDKGEESLNQQLLVLREQLMRDAISGLIVLDPADYHTLVLSANLPATDALRQELQNIYDHGRALVVSELQDQGAAELEAGLADEADLDLLDELSDVTASRVINDVQSRATASAAAAVVLGLTGAALADRVLSDLEDGSTASIETAAAGADHSALAMGRSAEGEENDDIIKEIYYSCVLDDNSCEVCEAADGATGESEDEIPPAPNPDCDGRDRCRCILIYVYAGESGKGFDFFANQKDYREEEHPRDDSGRWASGAGGGGAGGAPARQGSAPGPVEARKPKQWDRAAAAKRAWVTIRANRAAKLAGGGAEVTSPVMAEREDALAAIDHIDLANAQEMDTDSSSKVSKIDSEVIIKRESGLPSYALRTNVPKGTDMEREQAAGLINKALGNYLDMPAVRIMEDGDEKVMLMTFMKGKTGFDVDDTDEDWEKTANTKDIDRIALFDMVVGNEDRHPGNFIIDEKGHMMPIDHGLILPNNDKVYGNEYLINSRVYGGRKNLAPGEVRTLKDFAAKKDTVSTGLKGLNIEQPAIDSMWKRVDRLIREREINRMPERVPAPAGHMGEDGFWHEP